MITGFNTDVEHAGVTYHVQTEDKGLDTPLILSLVYVGGAILASKRTNYKDLIDSGFEQDELAERLQRQHKLICAAIRAGRIEDLKRMGAGDTAAAPARTPTPTVTTAPPPPPRPVAAAPSQPLVNTKAVVPPRVAENALPPRVERAGTPPAVSPPPATPPPSPAPSAPPVTAAPPRRLDITTLSDADPLIERTPVLPPPTPPAPVVTEPPPPAPPPAETAIAPEAEEEAVDPNAGTFYIRLLDDEGEFRAGELVTIRVHVGRGKYGRVPVREADVTIKVLGTTFRPLIVSTETDEHGIAHVRALLPRFTSGRAAILIRARHGGYEAELRRIIKQS